MKKIMLPEGFSAVPLTDEYEPGATDVLNAHHSFISGGNLATLEEMRVEWRTEGFHREADARVVLSPQGTVVAYGDVWDVSAPHVRLFSMTAVHPDYLGCGIGSYLSQWQIERAREKVPNAPEGARVVLHQSINVKNQAADELLKNQGFTVIRNSYRMRIDFDQPPAAVELPDGITIRSVTTDDEELEGLRAAYDSFKDHWGSVDEPFEAYHKRMSYFLKNDPNYDRGLHFIALEGDQVAGLSLCFPHIEEDPDMAWVGTLGVRRAWRKRGVGLALLQHSFQEFYKRGKPRAGLGVDAGSLTGALRLYERAGMYIWRKHAMYELELRPGKDLMKQTL